MKMGMSLGFNSQSSLSTVLGIVIVIVAIVGTQFLGWEWGSGQLVPTVIAVVLVGGGALLVLHDRLT